MRASVPSDSLVYLETNDLAAALQPIVDSKPFQEAAKTKPDFTALKGVQLAVAVTGFQANEEKVDETQSVANIKPRFVAVADTHAWNYQAVAFAENKLGQFVADRMGDVKMAKSDKLGGTWMVWSTEEETTPVAYALVTGSLIYFGNDDKAIEKCISVKKGEADSFLTTAKLQPAATGTLAQGYISTDGVAQIANIVGMKLAIDAGKEDSKEVKDEKVSNKPVSKDAPVEPSALTLLPAAVRESIVSLSWTATNRDGVIEDTYSVVTSPTRNIAADPLLSALADSLIEDIQDTSGAEIAETLSDSRPDAPEAVNTVHSTATRSSSDRIERSQTTDFGFIGWIVAQMSDD